MLSADPLPQSRWRAWLRRQCRGLQDQSVFLRITSWSPSTPAPPWLLVSPGREPYRRSLRRNFPIDRPAPHDRKCDARHLVGKRYRDKLEGLLLHELLGPHPQRIGMGLTVKQHSMRSDDEQFAQVPIAHLRNAPQLLFAARRVLLGRQPEKGGELARVGETRRILNGRRHCRGGDRAEAGHAHQTARRFIVLRHLRKSFGRVARSLHPDDEVEGRVPPAPRTLQTGFS